MCNDRVTVSLVSRHQAEMRSVPLPLVLATLLSPPACASVLSGGRVGFLPSTAPIRHATPVRLSAAEEAPPLGDGLTRVEVVADAAGGETSFDDLGVSEAKIVTNLAASKITSPNALQRSAFDPISSGRDTVLHAWTGSGKTLAFLLPLFELLDPENRAPQALVLCPSRELAFQINRVAEAALAGTGLSSAAVVGGANPNRQLEKIKKERPQLIVGTPGRVAELSFEWKKLKLQRVRHVIIDEVDDALRPPHLDHTMQIVSAMQDGRPLQLIFASATADTPAVRRVASQLLKKDPILLRLVTPAQPTSDDTAGADGAASPSALGAQLPESITHGVCMVEPKRGLKAVHALHHSSPTPRCLVFVNSPHRAKIVCEKLWESYGVPAAPLYGSQEREERVDVMRRLLDGRVRIAVTTEMGARGLDLPGLTHVVNLDLPTDAAHYVHRAGRCGRAGEDGTVVSFVPPGRAFVVSKLAQRLGVPLYQMQLKGGELNVLPLGKRVALKPKTAPKKKRSKGDDERGGGGGQPAAPASKTAPASKKRGYPKLASPATRTARGPPSSRPF